ncbi:restriction endonuclease PLD domain-containing protein [Butyrivibrio sp. NC2002]|uniref:restriction endonuclease PLD domain-containing protein n=1 Tax=Butyrivibrio sp. NC2002 TaxID=1410610 RepID=UPI00055D1CC3|nr:restriction endonuclease PLD domain-containing protein [Butyrivibrio sp. NC2002]
MKLVNSNNEEIYKRYLRIAGMLSRMSSESNCPYINSRVAENIFCLATGAENLGREDCSVDAKKDQIGVGVKTFLEGNDYSSQKIAEFNKDSGRFRGLTEDRIVEEVCKLRNERLRVTKDIHNLNEMIYHCVVRGEGYIKICEFDMDFISVETLRDIKLKSNSRVIAFSDGLHEYSFNLSKNTLYMNFDTSNPELMFNVSILDNPFDALLSLRDGNDSIRPEKRESIILPLFSDRGGRNVPVKSGLNQWNAAGRLRNPNEIYIPVPSWVKQKYPDFFPGRDEPFRLVLPDGRELSAKICQDNGKALMSNPNSALGEWLLREVMHLEEGQLLTYDKLLEINIDSVEIIRMRAGLYKIEFRPVDSYDDFVEANGIN